MPRYPGFIGPSYRSQSKIASDDRCVNLYPEQIENDPEQWALYPTPGFTQVATLSEGPVRGIAHINGHTFAVGGSKLDEIAVDNTVANRGSGINNFDGSPVTIHSNGDGGKQVFICANSKGYLYDLAAGTFAQVVDAVDFGGYVNGFFLGLDAQTSRLKRSNLFNGSTWDAGNQAQRNAGADKWASMIVSHKEIWLFGTATSEVWYNSGSGAMQFAPNPNVFIEYGILAPYSAALLDNAPVWLSQSPDGGGMVMRAEGYTPRRISNHAVEYALSTYATLTDARSWTYQEQGHSFYVLTFPTALATWVYDASTGVWHERGAWNGSRFTTLPVFGHAYAFGRHLTGDKTTGAIYRMGVDISSDGSGNTLRRMRRAPHLRKGGEQIGRAHV